MSVETVFETERLRLTNWLPEHVGDLVSLHGDARVSKFISDDGQPETQEQAVARLESWATLFATRRLGKLRVLDKNTGVFLGRAGFGVYGDDAIPEIGYAFPYENWGQGYASEAASGLRDWFFRETDGTHFLGFADVNNLASIHVLQKIGMTPTHIETIPAGFSCQFHIFNREDWHG